MFTQTLSIFYKNYDGTIYALILPNGFKYDFINFNRLKIMS